MDTQEPRDPQTGEPIPRQEPEGGTTPRERTEDATTPPANPEPDEDAVHEAREKLHRAAGGD